MRKLSFLFFAPLIFSCGRPTSEVSLSRNVLEDFSFTVDTVVVNPGEEILNLAWGIRLGGFSLDQKKLYLLNDVDQSVSVIDLDELKLENKIQFEKEGPNGIGQHINGVQVLNGDRFLFKGFQKNAIFNSQGEKEVVIELLAANIDSLSEDDENAAWYGLQMTRDEKRLFSLPGDFFEGVRDFLVADFPSQKGRILKTPAMDFLADYRIVLKSEEMMSVYAEDMSLQEFDGKIVLRNSASSGIYLYDLSTDSLQYKTYQHSLVPSKKEGKIQNEVSSQDGFKTEMAKLTEQIGFETFFWDGNSERYYRFGRIFLPKPDPEAEQKANIFLFAYDRDFNLIGETKLEELTKVPTTPFFKDGKLWSYVNVGDELGFAVMDLNF